MTRDEAKKKLAGLDALKHGSVQGKKPFFDKKGRLVKKNEGEIDLSGNDDEAGKVFADGSSELAKFIAAGRFAQV
jgi:hypothetical protein